MFIIKDTANGYDYYFQKNHNKVIVFDTEIEAREFMEQFFGYAQSHAQPMMFFGDLTIDELNNHYNKTTVVPLPENFNRNIIYYRDMNK